ncbi:MAG: DnaJ domain-containing protein [Syntrophaceae bacterium]|nr:DnaJ domain-containing protein [Syntrophaceae bacterium]
MKDYYRILGLKKNASEEEVRQRWVELMRKFHPDQQKGEVVEDEKAKEINEAYQVLKYPSTRMEFDLKRFYERRKRMGYVRGLSAPIGILAAVLIISTIYVKKFNISIQQPLVIQDKISQTNQIGHFSDLNDQNELSASHETDRMYEVVQEIENSRQKSESSNEINEIDQIDQPIQKAENSRQKPEVTKQINEKDQRDRKDHADATTPPRKARPGLKIPTVLGVPSIPQPKDPIDTDLQLTRRNPVANQTNQTDEINQTIQKAEGSKQVNEVNQKDQIAPPVQEVESSRQKAEVTKQVNGKDQTEQMDRIAASTPLRVQTSVPLIATEEEVKEFFAIYADRYTRKDLEEFLSLFSQRAVQNHQYRFEKIREIYTEFFNRSREIRYYIENTGIEIYQNGVEAKARYEIHQTLNKRGEKKIFKGLIRWALVKEHGALKILSLDYEPLKSP